MSRTSLVASVMVAMLLESSAVGSILYGQTEAGEGGAVAGIAASIDHRSPIRVLLTSGRTIEIRDPAMRGAGVEGVDLQSGDLVNYPVGEIQRI